MADSLQYRGLGILTTTQTCASEVLKSSLEQLQNQSNLAK